jgi:hypothetical protein
MKEIHCGGSKMDISKMLAEEEALEKQMFGENLEPEEATPPVVDQDSEDEEYEEEEQVQEPESQEPQSKPQQRTSWKQRYTNYKASTDNTIYNLRKDNAALKLEIDNLQESMSDFRKKMKESEKAKVSSEDPFKDVFTQEDVDVLGPEAIEVMKRALNTTRQTTPQNNEELDELKAEMARLKQDRRKSMEKEAASLEEETFEKFKVSLSRIVPNWSQIDVDPKFAEFIQQVDEYSGLPRKELFAKSVHSRDARRTALFYEDYMKLMPKTKEQILSGKVTPTGSGSSSPPDSRTQKTYSINDYETFMSDYAKGKYRGREKEAQILEAKFDRAFQEGRLR